MRIKLGVVTSLAVLLCAGLAGLSSGAARAAAVAYMRVIHADVSAPQVSIYLDGGSTPAMSSVGFGQVTDYWPLSAGTHSIVLAPTGQPPSAALVNGSITVAAGASYTVAAIGDSSTQPQLITFQDDNTLASGMSKVRVYHLSPDAGLAGVVTGGQTVIPNIDFKQASQYLTVKPGSYTFNLVIQHGSTTVPLNATLQPDKVTSVFGVGMVNATSGSADAFKFVVVSVAGMPTGLPQTGFNPHPQAASSARPSGVVWAWMLVLAAVLLLAAAFGYGPARRRLLAVKRG